jgi:hypothetical protein
MTTAARWIFPIEDDSDPELAYATGYAPPRRPAHIDRLLAGFEPPRPPSRGMRYVVGRVTFDEQDVPVLRSFLKALEAAPQGTEVIHCLGCDCKTIWVGTKLLGIDNSGTECDEHNCTHDSWHLSPTNKGESS